VNNRELIRGRQNARKIIVQALYQWHMNTAEVSELQAQYLSANNPAKFDNNYFRDMLKAIIEDHETIDEAICKHIDRPLNHLNPVELAILRLSCYELKYCLEIPFRVVIDEAISLCKTYGATEGHRYVNGVLHQLSQELRQLEVSQQSTKD
jgi:N utilization substance protein B